MGNCLLVMGLRKEKRPVTLLLVGLDSAGKTTAAKGIVGDPVEDVAPTVGFAPEYLEYRGCEVTIYDLGGGAKIRPVWAKYFSEVHGVIFVVDSTAAGRVGECREVLSSLLAHPKVAGKPVLILANKQDVDGAMDEIDLVEGLKVEEIVNRFKCPTRVETCSAIATRNRKPDKPIADGFRWLVDTIVVHYKEINTRVTKDLEREREQQRRELEERKERLRLLRAEREALSGERRREVPPSVSKLSSTSSSSSPSSSPPPSSLVTKAEVLVREEEEEEEEEEERIMSNIVANGTLPQHRTPSEKQELKELGFESSGEIGGASSSSSSSSLVKDTATTKTPTYGSPHPPTTTATTTTTATPPHRVILVRESSPPPSSPPQPQPSHTAATTTVSSSSTTSLGSGLHTNSRLDLSSERRHSECIPIDSDDEMFDLPTTTPPPPPHHHHHHNGHINFTAVTTESSAKAHSPPSLELESASKQPKKKSFLKRYHKTAPLLTRDQEVPPQQA